MSSITTSSQGSAFSFTAVGLLDPDGGLDGEELPDDVVGEFPRDGEELPDDVGEPSPPEVSFSGDALPPPSPRLPDEPVPLFAPVDPEASDDETIPPLLDPEEPVAPLDVDPPDDPDAPEPPDTED